MRLQAGTLAPNFSRPSLKSPDLSLDSFKGQRILLQFYRYAGCPPCNLHVREYMTRYAELQAFNVHVIAFFHSPQASLEKYLEGVDMPFDIVPDPEKEIYEQYKVESNWKGIFTGQALKEGVRAGKAGFSLNPMNQEGGLFGLPASFLIDENKVIQQAYYGKDVADTPPVDTVLQWIKSLEQVAIPT